MRLIDADAVYSVIDLLVANCLKATDDKIVSSAGVLGLNTARKAIASAPTIDPEELRPKGRWVKDGDWLICLNCESEINVKYSWGVENRKNYCPNCGAKMEDKPCE